MIVLLHNMNVCNKQVCVSYDAFSATKCHELFWFSFCLVIFFRALQITLKMSFHTKHRDSLVVLLKVHYTKKNVLILTNPGGVKVYWLSARTLN